MSMKKLALSRAKFLKHIDNNISERSYLFDCTVNFSEIKNMCTI